MPIRRFHSRVPLALALLIALSSACGGDDDDGVPAEYETRPGPVVPQPPADRRLTADGECVIRADGGAAGTSATLLTKVEASSSTYDGRESGFDLRMECGDTIADVEVSLYFAHGAEVLGVARRDNRWTVDKRPANVAPPPPASYDAGAEGDAGDVDAGDADAGDTTDATAPPPEPASVNGVGLPATDGTRQVDITLVEGGVRYEIRATIPWLASKAPATCQELKPGTGTRGSGGGCGSGSSSRRSSGGDWD